MLLNWTALVISCFIVLSMKSYSKVWRNRSANKGALLVPIGMPIICRKTEFPQRNVDIVDKKVNSEAQFPTGEVSVLRRLPIISPECVEIIGCYETLPSGVKNPLE